MPGTVSDVSATLVASTIAPAGVRLRTPCCCSAVGSRAYSGSTSVLLEHAAQCFRGVADLALAGQEHQHVAGRLGRQFVNGVDDRLGLVTHLGADDLVVGVVGIVVVVDAGTGTSSGR